MTTQTRTRPVVGYVLYRTDGDGGSDAMSINRMHGKMPALELPESMQRFLRSEGGAGNHPTPSLQFEIGELTAQLEDYSVEPERFFTPRLHTLRTRLYLPAATSGSAEGALKPCRIRGYYSRHRYGNIQRNQTPAMDMVFQPVEWWVKQVNPAQTADFGNTTPVPGDILRLSSEEWIWWADGVDQLADYRTLMGISIGG